MISGIKSIKNVGKYEQFDSTEQFDKNTMIFGFNGAGKSTLSDIFYSLTSRENQCSLSLRRTLNRPGEDGTKQMEIVLGNENGEDIIFTGEEWNKFPENLYVFNKYYIEDHVFVSKHLQGDAVPIGMGTVGTRCMRQRELLLDANKELINQINTDIGLLGNAGLKIKDFSNQKVTEKTKQKRFETMSGLTLYSLSEKKMIEDKIKSNTKYTKELADIEQCEKIYQQIRGIEQIDKTMLMKTVKKTLRVSSKEIAQFLSQTLTETDIRWAVAGYRNQKKIISAQCVDKPLVIKEQFNYLKSWVGMLANIRMIMQENIAQN